MEELATLKLKPNRVAFRFGAIFAFGLLRKPVRHESKSDTRAFSLNAFLGHRLFYRNDLCVIYGTCRPVFFFRRKSIEIPLLSLITAAT